MAENHRACASCKTNNEEDARFCEGCGASLARVCATCGMEASATARFCRGCGTPLGGQVAKAPDVPAAGPVRKTVTVMFADLVGSTSFEEKVDAETARAVIGHYHDLLRSTAERHRAGVTKYIGDGFMAVWGVPEIGPDDAARAVDAAVELQERFVGLAAHVAETHDVELALRVAVNTGEVVVGAGDADLVGDALNVGARLEAECPRGRVVVGEETWRSTRGRYGYESLGQVQVKGRTAPVAVYQWLGLQAEAADAAPFVGRADEVRRLQAVLDDAVAARAARLVTVIGDPGVGKSRLAAEFIEAHGDARVIEARCDVEATVALAPIVEVLRTRDLETDVPASVPERDRMLRDLNGLATGIPGSVEENFWALRRLIEVLASGGPVLLVLDDVQWADTLLLDLIEHLVEWVQEVPVLVLALARPELREIRPDLVAVSRWVSEAVHLGGLDAGATAELAAKVLGATRLPDELLRRLPSSTGGNPLFVRELIGMLAHDGVLVEQPAGWRLTIDVDAIAIPPTIHALLASRLERLDATDRRILEIASVVGSDFSLGTVRALAGTPEATVRLSLNRLRRLELAQPSGAYVGDEPLWRFHHVLIRDVAYRRLLKSDRAELHERLADWVEAVGAGIAFDADEMAARHLEAAHTYRVELGTVDKHTGDLASRSARHYAASARRALDRDELVSAGTQAARGANLAADEPEVHADLLLVGCEAFLSAGDVAAGAPLVDDLDRIASDALAPWATCYRCQFVVYTDPERLLEVDDRLQGAIDEFGRRQDPAGLAKAHRVRASARARLGRIGDCEADLFEALVAARQSGDHRQITAALGAAPSAALWGPSPVPKAGGRCLDVVRMQRMTTAAPSLEATSLRCLAVLELLRGRPDKARTMLADARQVVADLGLRHGLMETELFAGIIESMEGDPVAAEPHFRTALEGLDALGVGADAGLAAALLARSVLAQGRIDEADQYAAESERLAGRNLKTAIAWRAVRAEILAAQGRRDEATTMAQDAAAVAAGTDLVLDHAEACLALSRVLTAAGDTKGATAAHVEAERLFAAKEVASVVSRPLDPVAPVTQPPAAATTSMSSCLPVANRASEVGYSRFEARILAVRGECLALASVNVSDDAGNESTDLIVIEVGDDGIITYEGRFDEDFERAYRELERRHYAGEGSSFAEAGAVGTDYLIALNQGDLDRVYGELSDPEMRVENRSRSVLVASSVGADEARANIEGLDAMVASMRSWHSAVEWTSPTCCIARYEREAVGPDGEQYAWTGLAVNEIRHGHIASMCLFELDDEDAAVAYAEERVHATDSRLTVTNESCQVLPIFFRELRAHNVDGAVDVCADDVVYDDHRRISGDPVRGRDAWQAAIARVLEQYTHFEFRVLAVRGQRLHLVWTRMSDDDGNETATLQVNETDNNGLIHYHGRFDEEDFDGAFRELERRYYAGEGSAFAEAGDTVTNWTLALNRADFDTLFDELTAPDMSIKNRSRSAFPDRSTTEYRTTLEELAAMVVSSRSWSSAMCWLSPTCSVARCERDAVGEDGEQFKWFFLIVFEVRDGRIASMCEFELDDEEAAFAYADERVREIPSRLAVTNQATTIVPAFFNALRAHDVDSALSCFSDSFVYEDHRRISGDPVRGRDAMRAAIERIFDQYTQFEFRVMAVRGQRLHLVWNRWSDVDGNETATFYVTEADDTGRIEHHARFDEDDFESAYRELERRYYAAEGAAFAEAGAVATEWVIAVNHGDMDRAFSELSSPDMHVENRSTSPFPDPSVSGLGESFGDLNAMVASTRTWNPAAIWLSPHLAIARLEREAVGQNGEQYSWTWLVVSELRDGRFVSGVLFDIEDEVAAFAYADERVRATTSRLAVANRASGRADIGWRAMQAHDADALAAIYADHVVYDDRRRLKGDPIEGKAAMRNAAARIVAQYPHVEWRTLAVRGERLELVHSGWSDDADNRTAYLHVFEIGDDGLIIYDGRFDEDDFAGAYRELERRYYAGEGAAFTKAGAVLAESILALNDNDYDRLLGELSVPDFRLENRSRTAFPERSASDLRASFEQLNAMVGSSQTWISVAHWLSPDYSVARLEREAVGRDGASYTWTWVLVIEMRDGRLASLCEFEVEDEESAYAYAEERVRVTASRLAVTNRSCKATDAIIVAMRAHDVDGAIARYADPFVYDDRRRINGGPIASSAELRVAAERIFRQYNHFEWHTLAVRGERLNLQSSRWSDDAGNETTYLHVYEIGDDGRIIYEGRFDADDFEGAYRELDRRYYAGEGAAFAEVGAAVTDYLMAYNEGDFDRFLGFLTHQGMRFENRSQSVFPDRSVAEFRASIEELSAMVASARAWYSAICWLSPSCCVNRFEREAIGDDGEQYGWTRIYVSEFHDGRATGSCQFDIEDEDAAFAYAEERMRATASRLAVANRCAQQVDATARALNAHDIDAVMACYSDGFSYGDHRRITGSPVNGRVELRAAFERIIQQYSSFEGHTLAVRGNALSLHWSRWSDEAGNETGYLHVFEIDADGLVISEGRFDHDDFEGAYRELDRRYGAGEGAASAPAITTSVDWLTALNQGDFDRMLNELSAPDLRVENRSRTAFPDRSAAGLRESLDDLSAMMESVRTWNSAVHWVSPTVSVARMEREAVGPDGEQYEWTRIYVGDYAGGRAASLCEFELENEDAAFAYAEERMRATASRLAVTNSSCETALAMTAALRVHDIDGIMRCISDRMVYDDRRRLSGDPIHEHSQFRAAFERILDQYSHFEYRLLAVRGDRLNLNWSSWSDEAGNESAYLHVFEIGDDGLQIYEGRFDEDDFVGAYRVLEERYYAGEGAEFAEAGELATEYTVAMNQGDFDRVFVELTATDFRLENRSRAVFGDRSAHEFRASLEELDKMVASASSWNSVMCWLSPTLVVGRFERDAVGRDNERYTWTQIGVAEIRNSRLTSTGIFEIDDEEAAFAYAEERARAVEIRLAVDNRSSETVQAMVSALHAHDIDRAFAHISDEYVYDDRRRLTGAPIRGHSELRVAVHRIFSQYSHFEWRILAVRGEKLTLLWSRWSDEAGNETTHLHVFDVGDDRLISYEGRFDGDDFDGAYRELDQRYYAGEGAAFAEQGVTVSNYAIALNRGEFDRVFGELSSPDFRLENRSRSGFGDRTAAELRVTYEELTEMVASARIWHSAIRWLSPIVAVGRFERDAVGRDGERYAWTLIDVAEIRNGQIAFACQFEVDDEAAAFAYAEGRVQATSSRLSLTNLASRTWDEGLRALQARDTDAAVACYAEPFVYDDRRRLGGNPIDDIRTANERVLAQYTHFEGRTLAVRGERMHLGWMRWSNDAGFETCYLIVHEVDESGRIIYHGRFDDDDFEGAYRELARRFGEGEASAFAEGVSIGAEWLIGVNNREFDRVFGELADPEMRVVNRSSSAFPDRSADELRTGFEELNTMVTSSRMWNSAERWLSPNCCVCRNKREAIGSDGEHYEWTRLYVFEAHDGRCTHLCELDDEAAAFAYAEDRVRRAERG